MKILVTGANGLLGQHLTMQLLDHQHQVIATGKGPARLSPPPGHPFTYRELDIVNGPMVNALVNETRPDLIIHTAAMTQVDECELKKIDCWNVNVTATRFLLDAAKEVNARFIYMSSDFVFDGLQGPYSEEAEPNPVNYYGSTKWGAEKAVMESGLQWAIVRTVLVTGNPMAGTRQNIITWVKEKLEKGEKIKVVDDQYRTPTFVEDLAAGIVLVAEKNATGIFHISGKDTLTPYAMAVETARQLRLDESLLEKADSSSFTQPAPRPARTGFIISKAERELGFRPHSFSESLEKMFSNFKNVQSAP
jgi:dTDP-4-dehydrorhamnose reductase